MFQAERCVLTNMSNGNYQIGSDETRIYPLEADLNHNLIYVYHTRQKCMKAKLVLGDIYLNRLFGHLKKLAASLVAS